MFQRMANYVPIEVPDIDLTRVDNIEVSFEQKSSDVSLWYGGDSIDVTNAHTLVVEIPKSDAMQLDDKPVRGQVMYTKDNGVPGATKVFTVTVNELLKEDGYGD